jgi:hypothetical protein
VQQSGDPDEERLVYADSVCGGQSGNDSAMPDAMLYVKYIVEKIIIYRIIYIQTKMQMFEE